MGELMIRRNRGTAVPQYRSVSKTEKPSAGTRSQRASRATVTISETLRQLMSKVNQAESQVRESRRTLQAGESVLDEVQDSLGRMAELARKSAGGGTADRAALQAELDQLREDVGRMLRSASAGDTKLFLDGEIGAGEDPGLYAAVLGELSEQTEAAQALPPWLLRGIAQDALSPAQLLAALGLTQSASPSQLLAALANRSLDSDPAMGYLAALYLGAVISGGSPSGEIDPAQALEGLGQLMEQVTGGLSPDQAVELLTGGAFTSLDDFQRQFTGGTAPGLQDFLVNLLLSDSASLATPESPLLALLAAIEGQNLDLMMDLLSALQSSRPPSAGPSEAEAGATGTGAAAGTDTAAPQVQAARPGPFQVIGRDLSQVTFDASTRTLTVGGSADVTLLGSGQEARNVIITGSGTVTLQNVSTPALTVLSQTARIFSAGANSLGELSLAEGVSLTLDGNGRLSLGALRAGRSNTLYLEGGAVTLDRADETSAPQVPVLLSGPVSLAVQAGHIRGISGEPLEPFDLVWKTLLPNWSQLTAMELDGKQTKLSLLNGDPARLWLTKGDPSHGYSIHTLLLRGRDKSGRPQTRYAYLHWNQHTASFQSLEMYPNPFSVTGGEPGRDWIYEEESQTLRILSAQVTAISGGRGTDGNQAPFRGRIALADRIGILELTLGGVVCRASSGTAFSLGRGNAVTLLLPCGVDNLFESGAGGAGISLGEGSSLCIDGIQSPGGEPAGTLIASAGEGGAGIGRDSGGSQDQDSHILIRGGVITALGAGGGAGIGAGKASAMGPVIISGGTVTSTGGDGGGAGIGGALGAPVGDISIQGGTITAEATCHAAAIGAGVQGGCGDILIAGEARILKALGGDPGADIGACLSGSCGKVLVASGADLGGARLRTQTGIPLSTGESTVTLPQFPLSPRTLRLEQLRVSTREQARDAQRTIEVDQRWVSQIQSAYCALYRQLERGLSGLSGRRSETPVRDSGAAGTLLEDMRRSLLLQPSQALDTHSRRSTGDVRQLLQ